MKNTVRLGHKYKIIYDVDSSNVKCTSIATLKDVYIDFGDSVNVFVEDICMTFCTDDGYEFIVYGNELIESEEVVASTPTNL